jgi:hypothetical protein
MKRRDFLTGLLLTVATTANAQAQQKTKVHRMAVIDPIPSQGHYGGIRVSLLSRSV